MNRGRAAWAPVVAWLAAAACSSREDPPPPPPPPPPADVVTDAPAADAAPDSAELRCTEAQSLCAGACVDPLRDALHCGRCGNACLQGEQCEGGVCVGPETLRVTLEPDALPTGAWSTLRVTATGARGTRDVSLTAEIAVDGAPGGSDAAGLVVRGATMRYLAPATPGTHTVRAAMGRNPPAEATVTVRARRWVQLGAAVRSDVPQGDRAVTTAPSLAVRGDVVSMAYATRAAVMAAGRVVAPTVVRVFSASLADATPAWTELTGAAGLGAGGAASARQPAAAWVPLREGPSLCVAFEEEQEAWASTARVRCRVGDAWRDVTLPRMNPGDPVGSLALVARPDRADLYQVNDTLGQVLHLAARPEDGLDWSALRPVATARYDVDGVEHLAAAYGRDGRPFVAAVTLENLPRVCTVVRRYDADGARPDDAALPPWFGDAEAAGMPAAPVDRARYRQTGGLAVAAFEGRAAYATAWRAGATAFRVTAGPRGGFVRVVETGDARPTVRTLQPAGVTATSPALAYDGRGRLAVLFEGAAGADRRVHVGADFLAALTGMGGASRATSSRAPAVVATGRDLEELVAAFPTYDRASYAFRGEVEGYRSVEVWLWR